MRTLPTCLALLLLGCGSRPPKHVHPEPLSASEHERQAKEHEAEAEVTQEKVEPVSGRGDGQCIDSGVPLTSGGETIQVMKPCWTQEEQNASYLRTARAHRKAAADHRRWAHLLIQAEQESCEGLGESERAVSPFERTPDILEVEQYAPSGQLMGASVTFRKVVGLSKDWLAKSIACHQARAAKLGYEKDFMPSCPLAAGPASVSIVEHADTVVVTLRTKDPVLASSIYGRALEAKEGGHAHGESGAEP